MDHGEERVAATATGASKVAATSTGASKVAATSTGASGRSGEEQKLSPLSHALYYFVLFFAYWFGSNRFDMDGDGDFDPSDVQAYLADKGILKQNYKRPAKAKAKGVARRPSEQTPVGATPSAATSAGAAEAPQAATPGAEGPAADSGGGLGGMLGLDRDGDGDVDLDDVLESKVDGPSVEDEIRANLAQRSPWFIIIECSLCFGLWVVFAIIKAAQQGGTPLQIKAGMDSFKEGWFDLRLSAYACENYRVQIWRWFTYQWTHVGAMHVLVNQFLNVMLGVPLEGLHGPWRMAFMFNVGVFGGACCYFFNDAHTAVVGCSGGCYSLIGMHLADLIMNWSQKKFRFPTLFFIVLLVVVDVGSYQLSVSAENASHSAHMGGGIAGLLIGVVIGKNLKMNCCEKVVMAVCGIVGLCLVGFSLLWLSVNEAPLNIWESMAGEHGWCWVRQVYNSKFSKEWECIRCGTDECMAEWNMQRFIAPVSAKICDTRGWYFDGR